ncbi:MAG: GNAT family N-acetyltransferase [Chloroflexi bacterium]|nr:GNAT family N-acetyltransferase [Chloroflexota bacterium]
MATPTGRSYAATSERLQLRLLDRADVDTIERWLDDTDIRRSYLLTTEPVTPGTILGVIEWAENEQHVAAWAIEDHAGSLLGMGNWRPDLPFPDVFEVEVTLGPDVPKGRGFGTEAHALVIGQLFDTEQPRKVVGRAAEFNAPVIALARKLGFEEEGRLRRHVQIGDELVDLVLLGLFPETWHERFAG